MMSAGELRRALAAVFLLSIFLVFYLMWQQPSGGGGAPPGSIGSVSGSAGGGGGGQMQSGHSLNVYPNFRKMNAEWTWKCMNQRCERTARTRSDPPTSLPTCSMLCGSTQLWPQPTGPVTLSSRVLHFHHSQLEFETSAVQPALPLVQQSFAAFNANVVALVQRADYQRTDAAHDTALSRLIVKVSVLHSNVTQLRMGTNESYRLTVRSRADELLVNVVAHTFFGARHGLETLSQLLWWDEHAGRVGMLSVLKAASLVDAPKFPYRGIMIDTARNFMPLDDLKRAIIGMAASKLNAFHWHISDSQSFPLELPRLPQLAKYGAYGPDMVYTAQQVREFVEFARGYGVRVIIEVDTPAHTGNGWTWGPSEGLGELAVCVNAQPWSMYCGEPPCGQVNPENPHIYDVLEKIYRDIIDLTGETEIFHIGGDEVNLDCWSHFLPRTGHSANYSDLHDLWGNFTLRALQRLRIANGGQLPRHVIVWSSNLSRRPYNIKYLADKEIIVQSWGASSWSETPSLLSDGYKLILSHVDAWYLDCGFGAWRETGGAACDPYRPWQTMYSHKPWSGDANYLKQTLGGEACLWTEQVDAVSLDTRLWPRAAAFAERMWSDPPLGHNYLIAEDVYTRLNTHRDRLVGRGFQAEAMWPQWCAHNPGMCL